MGLIISEHARSQFLLRRLKSPLQTNYSESPIPSIFRSVCQIVPVSLPFPTLHPMFSRKLTTDRTDTLRNLAHKLEFEFLGDDAYSDISLLKSFHFYKQFGSSRSLHNVARRVDPLLNSTMLTFDYTWKVPAGNHRKRRYQTVFFIQAKDLALPDFYLSPESFFDRVAAWLGMQDIDYAEDKQFSDQNLLKGEDEELVRQLLLTPQFARMFRSNKDWTVEGLGYYMVIYKKRKLLTPAEISTLVKQGLELYSILREPD